MKVAVDFLSPHNMSLCMHMAREIRGDFDAQQPLRDWYSSEGYLEKQEKLQSEAILVHSAHGLAQQLAICEAA
jgi:hypothetical protein